MSKNINKRRPLNDLESIYKDYDSRFQKGGGGFGKVIISLLLFITIVGLTLAAGYYVFNEPIKGEVNAEDVFFEIKGSESVISGDEILYIIKYKNNSSVAIADAEVDLIYPEGFILEMVEPSSIEDEKNSLQKNVKWSFDKIGEGEEGEIKIRGIIVGNIGDEKEFSANLRYNPINTGAHFTKRAELVAEVESSFLDLAVEGNGKFSEGDKNSLLIKYSNKSAKSLENIKFIAYFPKGAELFLEENNSAIALDDAEDGMRKYELNIEELEGKAEKEIKMDVLVNAKDYGATFKFQIGYNDKEENFFLQEEKIYSVVIVKGSLDASLIINGNEKNGSVDFGETLNYSLVLKNLGDISFSDIKPKIIIDDNENLLNWDSLKLEEGGNVSDGVIFWDKETTQELEELNEEEELELAFSVGLKDETAIKAKNIIEGVLSSWAEITVGKTGTLGEEKKIKSNLNALKLNTNLELTSELRYFSENGDSIGSGPMPPKAGEKTVYKIFFSLTNSINEVKNIKVEGRLSNNVEWRGKTSLDSGDLYYDQEKNAIVWSIPKLPKNLSNKISGVFDISIEPGKEDAGRSVILLEDISIEGFDNKTGAKLSKTYGFMTTDDEASGGRGVVVE